MHNSRNPDGLEQSAVEPEARRIPAGQLATLLKVGGTLAAKLDLQVVLQTAVESAVEVLGLDTGAIYLIEGEDLLLGATVPPLPPGFPDGLRHARILDHPRIKACLDSGEPVSLLDSHRATLAPAERSACEARGLRSLLYVPLLLEARPVGAVIVGTTGEVRAFGEDDIDLCRTLSYEISLALANARLFESMQRANAELARAYDATLEGWSVALEMRDAETSGHTQRVVELALAIARRIGFAEPELVQLRRGALLHDIGKMAIPDLILHKPGALSESELAVMRRHPEYARAFLARIDYLAPALDVPYCHHERWDGSGYPQGLSGEAIPFSARVFAVADVYDALTSDRSYRPAWSHDEALTYVRAQAGKQFDPRVVAAFFDEIAARRG